MKKKSGMTLIEILISISIFSLLLTLMFYVFSISAKSWLKARNTVDIKDSSQILISRIESDIRTSAAGSIEIIDYPSVSDPNNQSNAISFLSAYNDTGDIPEYSILGQINWKKFVIFYLEDDSSVAPSGYYQLFSRKLFLGSYTDNFSTGVLKNLTYPPDANSATTYPMAHYIDPNTQSDAYLTSKRPVTRNIRQLNFVLDSSSKTINIAVKVGKPVNPNDADSPESPETYKLTGTVVLRNK
jgi:prepilin-type N-terminal cleavage/methylation domain-containing protein